jgi:hypothetical protein
MTRPTLTGKVEIPLPADLDPMDIAQPAVSDADGAPLLSATETRTQAPPSSSRRASRLRLKQLRPAQGKAQVSTAKKESRNTNLR